jgi:hypothetical protein
MSPRPATGRCRGARACAVPALLAAVMLGGGCAGPPRGEGTPAIRVVEQRVPAAPLQAATVLPLRPGTWTYRAPSNLSDGPAVVRRREPAARFRAQWSEREGARRTQYLAVDDAGNIVLTAAIDHADGALTIFEPPLVLVWAVLESGVPQTQTVAMRVLDASDPRRSKESGSATRSMVYSRDERLQTPLGEIDAARIDLEFIADLKVAEARERATWHVVPGRGIVVEQFDGTVHIVGLASRRSTYLLMLVDEPE